jgi:hypothetical protein
VFDSETVGEREQILTISCMWTKLRISGIGKEKSAKYGPLSRRCSRIILSPAGCQIGQTPSREHGDPFFVYPSETIQTYRLDRQDSYFVRAIDYISSAPPPHRHDSQAHSKIPAIPLTLHYEQPGAGTAQSLRRSLTVIGTIPNRSNSCRSDSACGLPVVSNLSP